MYCKNCGTLNNDSDAFCQNCGAVLQSKDESNILDSSANQAEPYVNQAQPYVNSFSASDPASSSALPMNWHKFLAYCGLWLGALANLITGIRIITGSQYEGYKSLVYYVIPDLKSLDTFYGLALFACVGLGCFTAYSLLKFKKGAPKFLSILYIATGVSTLIYYIGLTSIISSISRDLDLSQISASAIGTLIGSIAALVINYIYYKKRSHLFVN